MKFKDPHDLLYVRESFRLLAQGNAEGAVSRYSKLATEDEATEFAAIATFFAGNVEQAIHDIKSLRERKEVEQDEGEA